MKKHYTENNIDNENVEILFSNNNYKLDEYIIKVECRVHLLYIFNFSLSAMQK